MITEKIREYIKGFTIIALIILPIIVGAIYIYLFGVNVPFWDQWDVVPLFLEKFFNAELTIFDLFSQHNESRLFFPRIIMLILALCTKYNTVSQMFFMYALYCISFFILFLIYKKDHGIDKISLLQFIPITYFFFNLFQMSNMLFGVRIAQALAILTFLSSVYFIDSSKKFDRRFLGSIGMAIVSSFSFVAGLSTWPVCMIQIILQESRQKLRKIIIWGLSGILVFLIYFYGYNKPAHHPSLLYSAYNPLDGILCFITSVGSTVIHNRLLSPILGVLMLIVLCCILLLNKNNLNLSKNAKWLSLIIFSLFASMEIAIGRSGFGVSAGISQRYFLLTFFSIIGLYCISLNFLEVQGQDSTSISSWRKKNKKNSSERDVHTLNYIIIGVILTLLFIGTSAHFITGIEQGITTKQFREEIAYYLETYKLQPDKNLQKLYPNSSIVRERAPFLEEYKLSVFAKKSINININNLPKLENKTLYAIDTINGKIIHSQKEPIVINKEKEEEIMVGGWAVDKHANAPASAVFITINNTINIPARYGLDRKDVADAYKNKNFRYSGFKASFASSLLENGSHNFTIKIVFNDERGYYKPEQEIKIVVG